MSGFSASHLAVLKHPLSFQKLIFGFLQTPLAMPLYYLTAWLFEDGSNTNSFIIYVHWWGALCTQILRYIVCQEDKYDFSHFKALKGTFLRGFDLIS